ncbi:hypothetical protein [Pseudonocardia sp. C8]|nr:hypothetical protein [Pseudonocardia sp. C8]
MFADEGTRVVDERATAVESGKVQIVVTTDGGHRVAGHTMLVAIG